jgi:hypothetical protein
MKECSIEAASAAFQSLFGDGAVNFLQLPQDYDRKRL